MTARTDIEEPLDGSPQYRAISITSVTFPGGISPAHSMFCPAAGQNIGPSPLRGRC
ncbi:MAG: hypothetical protein ACI9WU_005318, partial [Myxococcota bacterium]